MMYDAYQGMADVGDRVRLLAQNAHAILTAWSAHPTASPWARMSAYYELVALAGFTHSRPDYAIDSIEIDGAPISVEERGVMWTPFCQLLRFRRHAGDLNPLVAPSGARRRSSRGTIRTLVRDRRCSCRLEQSRNVKARGWRHTQVAQHLIGFVLHRRGLPRRGGLPADGLRACGDRNVAKQPRRIQPASLTLWPAHRCASRRPKSTNSPRRSRSNGSVQHDQTVRQVRGRGRRVYLDFLQLCAFASRTPSGTRSPSSTSSTIASPATSTRRIDKTSTENI
jgi:poly-beta-hydroxyalkanoate depolymerase